MGIFDRMGKVISGNLNALIDGAEDDRKLVSLNIEEMDDQLKRANKEVISAVAAEKTLRKRVEELSAESATWEKRAELALKADDEALAREALKQKRRLAGEVEIAEKARLEQRDTALAMKGEYERMRAKLEEIKLRKGTIVAKANQARSASTELGAKPGGSAFQNFRAMEDRIEGKEAQAAAMREVEEALTDGPSATELEAKFRELERSQGGSGGASDPGLDAEMEALKLRVRVK